MSRKDETGARPAANDRPTVPWLAWVASGVGLLLAIGLFGMIGWQVFNGSTVPPAVTVEIEDIVEVKGGHRVLFRAHNAAGEAAAQVEIEGRLTTADGEQTSRVVLDYVPGHSDRRGGLFFTRDPRSSVLALRATGYAKP